MLNRHRGMSAKEFSEIIWSDKKYDNPTGNLRCTLYRLRNMFELMSENELIVTTKTGYRINTKLKIHTDYEHFEDICANIHTHMGKSEKSKLTVILRRKGVFSLIMRKGGKVHGGSASRSRGEKQGEPTIVYSRTDQRRYYPYIEICRKRN